MDKTQNAEKISGDVAGTDKTAGLKEGDKQSDKISGQQKGQQQGSGTDLPEEQHSS